MLRKVKQLLPHYFQTSNAAQCIHGLIGGPSGVLQEASHNVSIRVRGSSEPRLQTVQQQGLGEMLQVAATPF